MGKVRRMKKDRRENPEKYAKAAAELENAKSSRKAFLYGIPLISGIAAGVSFYLDSEFGIGVFSLVGIGGWLVTYLSELGGSIPKKDSSASAAIEFGRSK